MKRKWSTILVFMILLNLIIIIVGFFNNMQIGYTSPFCGWGIALILSIEVYCKE